MPGEPVISTARKTFIPSLPGFLKPDFTLDGLRVLLVPQEEFPMREYLPVT